MSLDYLFATSVLPSTKISGSRPLFRQQAGVVGDDHNFTFWRLNF